MIAINIQSFLEDHGGILYTISDIESYLKKDCCVCVYAKEEIVAVSVFNIKEETVMVDFLAVKKEFRNKKMIKLVALKTLRQFPFVNKFSFERARKYPERGRRVYSIMEMLGVRK